LFHEDNDKIIEESEVRCYNSKIDETIKSEIDICKEDGNTIGGSIFIYMKGIPIGIGSYTNEIEKANKMLLTDMIDQMYVERRSFSWQKKD
jgi:chorismate synthase